VPVDLVHDRLIALPKGEGLTPAMAEAVRLEQLSAYLIGGVSALMGVVAVVAPWLEKKAGVMAIEALGLPTGPDDAGAKGIGWVVPQHWSLQDTRWTMLALAVVLLLVTVLLLTAHRLEADTDGPI
jgi:uncharacterized membrane protein HdeD (DUF308 family)